MGPLPCSIGKITTKFIVGLHGTKHLQFLISLYAYELYQRVQLAQYPYHIHKMAVKFNWQQIYIFDKKNQSISVR